MSVDPRPGVIGRRLERVERIVAVTGGKGGIGKSAASSCLALALAQEGRRVGLLDLDLTGPCDHLILGAETGFPEEDFGVVPPEVAGIRFMSVAHFCGAEPLPLRGEDVSNALIELLTIVQWRELDFLVVDMPPGLGDTLLDAVRLLRQAEYLVLATASPVVLGTVTRAVRLLRQMGVPVLGVLENMARQEDQRVAAMARAAQLPFLGSLPYDPGLEQAMGDPAALVRTRFGRALAALARSGL